MRAPSALYPLFVAIVALACDQTPTRPAALAAIGTRSFAAEATEETSPPRNVFLQTRGNDVCLNVTADGQDAMTQTVTLHTQSSLVLYFTFEWGSLSSDEEGLLAPTLDSSGSPFEWGFVGNDISRTSGTVMWSFANVPAGTHTVGFGARLQGGDVSAELNDCALTVFVVR
jgi:hypothetical protein